jgi:DNA processing protein
VFAVPGSPIDPRAEGTNGLLKQGATLVTEASDVVSVVRPILGQLRMAPEGLSDPDTGFVAGEPDGQARNRLVELLGPTPVALDDLIRLSGLSPAVVRTILFELELAGRIERRSGNMISLL